MPLSSLFFLLYFLVSRLSSHLSSLFSHLCIVSVHLLNYSPQGGWFGKQSVYQHQLYTSTTWRRKERRKKVKVSIECVNLVNRRSFGGSNFSSYLYHRTWKSFPLTGSNIEVAHLGTIWAVHLAMWLESPPPVCPLHSGGLHLGLVICANFLTKPPARVCSLGHHSVRRT